jgi:hypothetical protein
MSCPTSCHARNCEALPVQGFEVYIGTPPVLHGGLVYCEQHAPVDGQLAMHGVLQVRRVV